ncbi:MAG: hypothetical protein ACOY3P_22320 [Planctomycetota bacterium]
MGRIYAGTLGPLALLVTLARAALQGDSIEAALWSAWIALWVFAAVGWILGSVGQRTVDEAVTRQFANEMLRQQEAGAADAVKS